MMLFYFNDYYYSLKQIIMKRKTLYLVLLSTVTFYSQTQIGSDIDGEGFNDYSGWSISLSSDGSIVAIGAPYNDGNGTFLPKTNG
jgi:hypothetical protein